MPSRRSVLAACAAGVGSLAGCLSVDRPATDGSWSRRTLDNARTGSSPTAGPTTDLHTVWRRDRPDNGVTTSPVVDDDTVYFAYSKEARRDERGGSWVEAFDAPTGESRWETELFRTDAFHYFYHSDSLVVDDDRLFVQTKPGLRMLGTDGEEEWTLDNLDTGQQLPDAVPPIVTDETVVTGTYDTHTTASDDETVFGIDAATGAVRWQTRFPEWTGMWRLSAADGTVFVPFGRDGLVALDTATGAERWRWEGPVASVPTVLDDVLLVGLNEDSDDALLALDRADRSVRWRRSVGPRWGESGISVADDRLFHVSNFGVETPGLDTGERLWRAGGERAADGTIPEGSVEIKLQTTPVVADGAVYVPGWIQRETMYGHLFVFDAATGDERGRVELGRNEHTEATPAVTSDLAFVGSNWGNLVAVGECSAGVAGHCLVD